VGAAHHVVAQESLDDTHIRAHSHHLLFPCVEHGSLALFRSHSPVRPNSSTPLLATQGIGFAVSGSSALYTYPRDNSLPGLEPRSPVTIRCAPHHPRPPPPGHAPASPPPPPLSLSLLPRLRALPRNHFRLPPRFPLPPDTPQVFHFPFPTAAAAQLLRSPVPPMPIANNQ
jgi:hypothetical protein